MNDATTGRRWPETVSNLLTIRAEALFASTLQPSEVPSAHQVQDAVATMLRRIGIEGCAVHLAEEAGEHPVTAAARMGWALSLVQEAYPVSSPNRHRSGAETSDGAGRRPKSPGQVAMTGADHFKRTPALAGAAVGSSA